MNILICKSSLNPVNCYISDSILRSALRRRDISSAVLVEQGAIGAASASGLFDALLVVDGQDADTNPIRASLHRFRNTAIWFFEDPYEFPVNQKMAKYFQAVYTNDRNCAPKYAKPARFLPLGADPVTCYFPVRRQWPVDITFIGSAWPNRLEILFALHRRLGRRLKWNVHLLSNPSLQPILSANGWLQKIGQLGWTLSYNSLPIRDVAAHANRSRITLTLPRDFSLQDRTSSFSDGTLPPRIFETGLAGSTQIISASIARKGLLDNGLLPFTGIDELCTRADSVLSNDALGRDLAVACQEECLEHHTYDNRLEEIMDCLRVRHDRKVSKIKASDHRSSAARAGATLIVSHNRVGQAPFGGVEVFAERLMAAHPNAYLAAPLRVGIMQEQYVISDASGKVVRRLSTRARPVELLEDSELENWLEQFVVDYGISSVLFAHLIHWPISLVQRFNALGIATVVKLNDFFYICPSINLLSAANVYCRRDILGPSFCDDCLAAKLQASPGSAARRLKDMETMLRAASKLIAPSESTRRIYDAVFSGLGANIVVKEYPIEPPLIGSNATPSERLRVLVAGNFVPHKGGDQILEIIKELPECIDISIWGDVDAQYTRTLKKLSGQGSVRVNGAYPPGELPDAFTECDVALFLSIWPETYLITLTEAMLRGCVPIVFNIGAPAERVIDGVNGFSINVGNSTAVIDLLRSLSQDKSVLPALRDRCKRERYVTAEDYVDFLGHLLGETGSRQCGSTEIGRTLSNRDLGLRFQGVNGSEWQPPSPPAPVLHRYAQAFVRHAREYGTGVAVRKSITFMCRRLLA